MKNLLNLNHLFLTLWLLVIHATVTHAAVLTFTPAMPVVQINQTLTL